MVKNHMQGTLHFQKRGKMGILFRHFLDILAYTLTSYLSFFWHMYLAYLLTFFLAFYLLYLRKFFVVEVWPGTL